MAYSKTTWATGDVIDAAKLNKIEDGIAANDTAIGGLSPFSCEGTIGEDGDSNVTITVNKKASELYNAISAGKAIVVTIEIGTDHTAENVVPMIGVKDDDNGTVTYSFRFVNDTGIAFSASSLAGTDDVVLTAES